MMDTRNRTCHFSWFVVGLGLVCLAQTAYGIDPGRAMSQYIHDRWESDKGFPGGLVYAITQTADGYLWIGTEKGLVRFDGLSFHLFQHANTPSLPAGPVLGLAADAEGRLWIRMGNPSLLRYTDGKFENVSAELEHVEPAITAMARGKDGEVLLSALVNGTLRYSGGRFVKLAPPAELPNFLVISIAESQNGKIWIGTRDVGLFSVSQGHFSDIGQGLPDKKVNCILPITNEEVWVGTDNGVVRWNGTAITSAGLSSSLSQVQALTMIRDRDLNVWVGTASGLLRVNTEGTAAFAEPDRRGLAVSALFEDREGNIWVGTSQGIERLRDSPFVTFATAEGMPAGSQGPIYIDAENRAWFAPAAGGLYWLKSGQVAHVTSAGLSGDVIYSITGDKNELWIGRQKGGLTHLRYIDGSYSARTYTQTDGLAQNSVYAVHRNRDGTVWAGTLSGGVSRFSGGKFTTYTINHGLASNTVDAILEGSDGTMWFATPNGLSVMSRDRWRTFTVRDGLPSEKINCLFEDSAAVLWLGTDDGLAFLNNGRFQLPEKLPASLHEQILGLTEDEFGSLWIATANHVLRVTRANLRRGEFTDTDINEYGLADGLPGSEGVKRHRSVAVDSRGGIWFSLNRGLSVVDPSRLRRSSVPAIVHINTMTADGRPVDVHRPINIPSARRRISFTFAGLSLAIPERVKFRYRLDGVDRDWSEPVKAGEAIYANLSPGSYRFRVIASNSDGVWNSAEEAIGFEIAPAFWQTWLFWILGAMTIALTVIAFYRFRLHQLTRQLNVRFDERLAERTLIAQELHDTLLQGFLSASMQLDVAVDQLPPESPARPRLRRVLELMRQVTEEGRNALRGLRSSTNVSLDLEQSFSLIQREIGAGEETDFRVIVEGASQALHPVVRDEVYRIGREAVVNAFRHSQAKNIEVEVAYLSNRLRILVRDDGCGIDSEVLNSGREGHFGLPGMRERAERIGARLKVLSRGGLGTEVQVSVPGHVAFKAEPLVRPNWFAKLSRRGSAARSAENGSGAKDE
ncbi:MAG: histidine kinase [Pyrinomonadaceae bacterium]|nr:histidine kinase [Pyrinomonadaceae bacterium]